MKTWRFHPPLWAVLASLAGCAITGALGGWQLQRGAAKQELQARYTDATTQAPVKLNPQVAGGITPVVASGRYLADRQLLLDNQTRQRRPGYKVWTPLRLPNGSLVLVNRGWVAGGGDRATAPELAAPTGEITVRGLWRALPQPGMRLDVPACRAAAAFPLIVNYPTAEELACVLGEPVAAGELLLDPTEPGGFVREWTRVSEFPPEKHYAYAAQWFAFAATIAAIFFALNFKHE